MIHELLTEGIEPEADAKCTCGEWRLLRMSTTTQPDALAQRKLDIETAFQQHLDKVGQVE
jgi:hypothetical protein